jgi:hypothetical protein
MIWHENERIIVWHLHLRTRIDTCIGKTLKGFPRAANSSAVFSTRFVWPADYCWRWYGGKV